MHRHFKLCSYVLQAKVILIGLLSMQYWLISTRASHPGRTVRDLQRRPERHPQAEPTEKESSALDQCPIDRNLTIFSPFCIKSNAISLG